MSEYQVTGPEVKKLVKAAARQPISFAFSAGKGADDSYLALHRKKAPEVLWKTAKKEGPSNKAAAGNFALEGKLLSVTCTNEIPGLAKKLKKFLKANRCSVNIQVLDGTGNVLESDIEDLPDDPDMADGDVSEAGGSGEAAPAEAEGEAPAEDGRKDELSEAFKESFPTIRAKIAASEPALAEKLKAAAQAFAVEIKADRLDRAEQILKVLKRQAAEAPLEAAPTPAVATVEAMATAVEETTPESAEAENPEAWKWARMRDQAEGLLARATAATPISAPKLTGAWQEISALAEAGQVKKALAKAGKLIPTLERLGAAAPADASGGARGEKKAARNGRLKEMRASVRDLLSKIRSAR